MAEHGLLAGHQQQQPQQQSLDAGQQQVVVPVSGRASTLVATRDGQAAAAPATQACSLPLPHQQQHGENLATRRHGVDPRHRMSQLLSSNLVAAGRFATGRSFDPRTKSVEEMPQACMPRIKHKAMSGSLALPLTKRQAEKLKAAQVNAGQERDVNAEGVPETRLPWAVRPDNDFKIVNHKAWSAGVVAPVVREVSRPVRFVRGVGGCVGREAERAIGASGSSACFRKSIDKQPPPLQFSDHLLRDF